MMPHKFNPGSVVLLDVRYCSKDIEVWASPDKGDYDIVSMLQPDEAYLIIGSHPHRSSMEYPWCIVLTTAGCIGYVSQIFLRHVP